MTLRISLLVGLFWMYLQGNAQTEKVKLSISIKEEQKNFYQLGDSISFSVKAQQKGKDCFDGIKKIRLFTKGLKIENQQPWKQIRPDTWTKQLLVSVQKSKKGQVQLTAYRKTDKGTSVETVNLKLKHNNE